MDTHTHARTRHLDTPTAHKPPSTCLTLSSHPPSPTHTLQLVIHPSKSTFICSSASALVHSYIPSQPLKYITNLTSPSSQSLIHSRTPSQPLKYITPILPRKDSLTNTRDKGHNRARIKSVLRASSSQPETSYHRDAVRSLTSPMKTLTSLFCSPW